MTKLSVKESFEALPSDEQKRLLGILKNFNRQLRESGSDRLEWRKWRVWYYEDNKKDWLYVYAQTENQAKEFANQVRHKELAIVSIEEVK